MTRPPGYRTDAAFHPSCPLVRIPSDMDEQVFTQLAEEYGARLYAVAFRLLKSFVAPPAAQLVTTRAVTSKGTRHVAYVSPRQLEAR